MNPRKYFLLVVDILTSNGQEIQAPKHNTRVSAVPKPVNAHSTLTAAPPLPNDQRSLLLNHP